MTAERKSSRQPIHVVYGGAHLFTAQTIPKLASIASTFFHKYIADENELCRVFGIDELHSAEILQLIRQKLVREAVEDFRVDFEDGFGVRADSEEDAFASAAGMQTAQALEANTLPPFFGIRVKPLSERSRRRAQRTLEIFTEQIPQLPAEFVVTLPKVISAAEVLLLAEMLEEVERARGYAVGSIGIEVMVETPQSIFLTDGRVALPAFVEAARGRLRSAHYGAYDYTASLGITSGYQDMRSGASDFARHVMQVSLAGTGVNVSDGATNVLPIPPYKGDVLADAEAAENRIVVERALRLHYDICRRSLANGFYQGWDLHPAQIPARLAAVFAFFAEQRQDAAARLTNFIDEAARATRVGDVFDDAATGQGLINFFTRAIACGAMTEEEAARQTGIRADILATGNFETILAWKRR